MAIAPVSNRVTRWSLQESRATRSARVTSRCPTGERFSMIPSRWLSQSSCFSKPGNTGFGELMPCRVAFHITTALPCAVLGPTPSPLAVILSFIRGLERVTFISSLLSRFRRHVYLRVVLDAWRVVLQLSHAGEGLYCGEVAPSRAL